MTDVTSSDAGILFRKLAEVMAEMGPVAAKGRNDFLGTKYVEEEDLFDAISSKLSDRQVMLIPSFVGVVERGIKVGKQQKDSTLSTATFDMTFCDGATGYTHTARWVGAGEDAGDKALAKAETSAMRTFLLKTFMVSSSENSAPTSVAPAHGGAGITQEQVSGLHQAYDAAGRPADQLEQMLNTANAPKEREGKPLDNGERIATLNTTEAIALHKKLAALPPAVTL